MTAEKARSVASQATARRLPGLCSMPRVAVWWRVGGLPKGGCCGVGREASPDAGLPDAGLADAGLPDAGLPDAGCGCDGFAGIRMRCLHFGHRAVLPA